MVPLCCTPQDQESTSTSSLCLLSSDSPLMSPIFAKMSDAITELLSYDAVSLDDCVDLSSPWQKAAWRPAGATRSIPPADSAGEERTSPSSTPDSLRLLPPALRRRPAA